MAPPLQVVEQRAAHAGDRDAAVVGEERLVLGARRRTGPRTRAAWRSRRSCASAPRTCPSPRRGTRRGCWRSRRWSSAPRCRRPASGIVVLAYAATTAPAPRKPTARMRADGEAPRRQPAVQALVARPRVVEEASLGGAAARRGRRAAGRTALAPGGSPPIRACQRAAFRPTTRSGRRDRGPGPVSGRRQPRSPVWGTRLCAQRRPKARIRRAFTRSARRARTADAPARPDVHARSVVQVTRLAWFVVLDILSGCIELIHRSHSTS